MKFGKAGKQRSFLHNVGRTAAFLLAATTVSAVTGVLLALGGIEFELHI